MSRTRTKRPPARPTPPAGPPKALIGAVVALVAVIAVVAVVVVNSQRQAAREDEEALAAAVASANALPAGGGIGVHHDLAAAGVPEVSVYEDFQCPWCGVFARGNHEALGELASSGQIRLTHHLMTFLDNTAGNDASTRATNAAMCADDQGRFSEFHTQVFLNQPAAQGGGWTDAELVSFGSAAGIAGAAAAEFEACMAEGTYLDYIAAMQVSTARDGVTSTPTVVIEGQTLSREHMQLVLSDPSVLPELILGSGG